MNEIEKRARELLAAEYERSGKRMAAEFASLGTSEHQPAINAIVAALSAAPQGAPDGWVLVPVGPTDEMSRLGNEAIVDGEGAAGVWLSMIGALLAAKPEPPK